MAGSLPEKTETQKFDLSALILLLMTLVLTLPWIVIRIMGTELDVVLQTVMAGLSIIAAGFMVSWACELLQLDVPPGFAIAVLAFVNVLPEYAVDIYFSYQAAFKSEYVHFATSNMTGANRMLIGIGWALIVLINFWRQAEESKRYQIEMSRENVLEVAILLLATLYSFLIPLKGTLSVLDSVLLIAIFGYYISQTVRMQKREPSLGGPPALLEKLPIIWRRIGTWTLFCISGTAIFLSAEPFSEGLIHIGRSLGIEEFILVQWVAPIASEAPELISASYFAWKLLSCDAFSALVSSKVNQWTLLVGFIPLVYGITSLWTEHGFRYHMQLDLIQRDEIFLTAAQSLLGGVMLADRRFQWWEAVLLFTLFTIQLMNPSEGVRVTIAWIYIALAVIFAFRTDWRSFLLEFRDILRARRS